MDEQLRPTQPHAHEIDLLTEVAEIVRQAIVEYQGGHTIAARHQTLKGMNTLRAVFDGDAL
jgi:hypothetical protein